MTRHLSPTSPRLVAASRFGAELNRAMRARQVGSKTLGAQAGSAPSAIAAWRAGQNLPRLDTATRLADSLRWPKLVELAKAGRVGVCRRCGAEFTNEGGQAKLYCSTDCRAIDTQLREPPPGRALADAVRAELERVGGKDGVYMRRRPLRASDIWPWVEKAWAEAERARGIVMLLPANRTEQGWWQDLVEPFRDRGGSGVRVEFLRGRHRFIRPGSAQVGPNERPPFGCCLLIWTPSAPVPA